MCLCLLFVVYMSVYKKWQIFHARLRTGIPQMTIAKTHPTLTLLTYLERPNQNHLFQEFCQQYILARIFDNLEFQYCLCHPWVGITLYINLAQITLIWLAGLGLGLVTHRLL